jgi:hypothetical protein
VPSLAPGATSSGTVTVTVSAGTASGTYFLLACADDYRLRPGDANALLSTRSNRTEASRWSLQDLGAGDDYVAFEGTDGV